MKCPHCGNEIEDGSKFCKYCAKKLDDLSKNVSDGENKTVEAGDDSTAPLYYIPESGTPFSKVPPKKVKRGKLRALISVILFVSLMFICQSCVISGYTASLMLDSGGALISPSFEESLDIVNEIVEKVNEKTVLILFISNLVTLLVICLIFTLRRKNPRTEMSLFKINPFRFPSFAVFGMALNVFVSIVLSLIPFPENIMSAYDDQYSSLYMGSGAGALIFEIISVALVTGIVEELIFRGIALKRLIPAFGKTWAVIISSVIFGLAHGTPIAILYSTLLGALFGILYTAYGSVIPSIICHIFFNLTSYVIGFFPEGALFALFVISICLIILLGYRTFVRRPTFYDVFYDTDGRIPPINERERELISNLREMQKHGGDADSLIEITVAWHKNRKTHAKDSKNKNKK